MKKKISRNEAKAKIGEFFSRKRFEPREAKKMKKLAMRYRISLREERKKFCRKCFSKMWGKTRVKGGTKTVECASCGFLNRFKIRKS